MNTFCLNQVPTVNRRGGWRCIRQQFDRITASRVTVHEIMTFHEITTSVYETPIFYSLAGAANCPLLQYSLAEHLHGVFLRCSKNNEAITSSNSTFNLQKGSNELSAEILSLTVICLCVSHRYQLAVSLLKHVFNVKPKKIKTVVLQKSVTSETNGSVKRGKGCLLYTSDAADES